MSSGARYIYGVLASNPPFVSPDIIWGTKKHKQQFLTILQQIND